MRERYVIDTNVLIAASAGDPQAGRKIDATPSDPELRAKVWSWLTEFDQSSTRLLLDLELKIFDEYSNTLGFNDYGRQVVMNKWSTASVDNLPVQYDENGHGVLPAMLEDVVHDLSDRKMVGAALEAHNQFGQGCIAFAGDTDWHDWEAALAEHHVLLEPIIEEWSRQKHAEKQAR